MVQTARQLDVNVAFAAALRFNEAVAIMVTLVAMECYICEAEERLGAEALQQRLPVKEKRVTYIICFFQPRHSNLALTQLLVACVPWLKNT